MSVPDRVTIETVAPSSLPGWDSEDLEVARAFGDSWLGVLRTAILRVPSVTTEGRESNLLFNPLHSEFAFVQADAPEQIRWDARLFPML